MKDQWNAPFFRLWFIWCSCWLWGSIGADSCFCTNITFSLPVIVQMLHLLPVCYYTNIAFACPYLHEVSLCDSDFFINKIDAFWESMEADWFLFDNFQGFFILRGIWINLYDVWVLTVLIQGFSRSTVAIGFPRCANTTVMVSPFGK